MAIRLWATGTMQALFEACKGEGHPEIFIEEDGL